MADTEVTLIYEGIDITDSVLIAGCVHRDVSRSESDCLKLRLENAETWFRWGPKANDRIRVKRNGYDTGELYLNTVLPEDGSYVILATGMKCGAKQERFQTYRDMTLAQIMQLCAAECGMGARLYGVDGATLYPYLLREELSAPAFLEQLCACEGALLKCLDGDFVAIGIEYAQKLFAVQTLEVDMGQTGVRYMDRRDMRWAGVQILSPYASGSALDAAAGGQTRLFGDLPVQDDAQAKRWAKGLLLPHNRQAETLVVESPFNPGYTAAARVDVDGNDDVFGAWIIDEVEHDLIEGTSCARMLRSITTIF